MRRTRTGWAVGVILPWCLGIGLLVSITADAGQNATVGGSFASLSSHAFGQPDDLVPVSSVTSDFAGLVGQTANLLTPVTFDLGRPEDFKEVTDELEPRQTTKRNAGKAPAIDRSHKGDPALGLRPTFDSQLRSRRGVVGAQMLGPHDDAMPAASFSLQDEGAPLDGATTFSPWAEGEDMQGADDGAPSASSSLTIAMRPAALKERLAQGATPKVSRAEALSSTTPAPADGAPVAVVFTPQQLQAPSGSQAVAEGSTPGAPAGSTIVPRVGGHPNYAALLTGERGARERKCLAEAVYFESRSEPEAGQAAVAQVVLNRATSGLYPASICGVVYQNRTHYKACQFSFACEGKSLRISEPESWQTAVRVSEAVLEGRTYLSDVGGSTHYHANYVRPGWSRRLVKMDVIGHHIFYKLRRGQT